MTNIISDFCSSLQYCLIHVVMIPLWDSFGLPSVIVYFATSCNYRGNVVNFCLRCDISCSYEWFFCLEKLPVFYFRFFLLYCHNSTVISTRWFWYETFCHLTIVILKVKWIINKAFMAPISIYKTRKDYSNPNGRSNRMEYLDPGVNQLGTVINCI